MKTKVLYRGSPPESKFINTAISHAATTTSTTILTALAIGASTSTRVGRKVKVKSVDMNVTVNGPTAVKLRCILYAPKQADDIIALTNHYDSVNNDRYWIIKDWYQTANLNNATQITRHRFPMGLGVEFDGPLLTDLAKNPLKLYIHTNAADDVRGHTKVWYTDN